MANNRRGVARGPSPIFKKRMFRFSTTVPNTTPVNIASIVLRETGTIYSVKIDMAIINTVTGSNVQELNFALRCVPQKELNSIPDFGVDQEIETINGFYVGSLWSSGVDAASGDTHYPQLKATLNEKYRFRRKCDENTRINLFADSVVRQGAAQSVQVFGMMYVVVRVR